MNNVEVHIFSGSPEAFDAPTRDFAMQRAFAILDELRGTQPAEA